ncbi:hypothetical protein HSB1_00470 [Halogranum salarium B-1]|uniref:Uncharacterized protein n=1 Tax=Halogranum salarium B-1 TaxID=1210908 RepID=J3JHI3_9EURY|nr:hypothetical protein HSB1_00470 [Halogranum salarium B-1]
MGAYLTRNEVWCVARSSLFLELSPQCDNNQMRFDTVSWVWLSRFG